MSESFKMSIVCQAERKFNPAGFSDVMVMLSHSLENYKASALECVHFKLIRSESDVDFECKESCFHPEYAHQLYGEDETIFGYKDLGVYVYYLAGSLHTYVNVDHTDKLTEKQAEMKIDDPLTPIVEIVPPGFSTNKVDFLKQLAMEAKFKPFGHLINTYEQKGSTFVVYKCEQSCPGFLEYHTRLQTFLMFFIDGASFIDVDDENWTFYLTYEKWSVNGETHYAVVGYSTVYLFYAYPELKRARLSQFLVLPPFSRKGHGSRLLEAIYSDLEADKRITDLTVEDPSDEFTAMRDMVDTKRLSEIWTKTVLQGSDYKVSLNLMKLAQEKVKINKKQLRRIFEIVKLLHLESNKTPKKLTNYKDALKTRIKKEFEKPQTRLSKALCVDNQSSHDAAAAAVELEHQATQVIETFDAILNHYNRVVAKVQCQ